MTTPKRATSRRKPQWALFPPPDQSNYIPKLFWSRADAAGVKAVLYPDYRLARVELREARTGKGKKRA